MSDTGAFKKFENKVLAGAVTLVIGLTSAVWAITWHSTDNKAEEARVEIERLRSVELEALKVRTSHQDQKLALTDERQKNVDKRLESIEATLSEILKELRRR